MDTIERRTGEISSARNRLLALIGSISDHQGAFHAEPRSWSIQAIVEHLVLAERMGIHFMWQAAAAIRRGHPLWNGPHTNRGALLENIIEQTWKPKEVAPPDATPKGQGPLSLWTAELRILDGAIGALGEHLAGLDLGSVIAPHFLSGPLDADQRLQFIRFHLERHEKQVRSVMADPEYPTE